jgi:hypothetical protein
MTHAVESSDDDLDADHDNAPLRLCPIRDMIEDVATPGLACRVLHVELNLTSMEEPGSFCHTE